MIKWLFMGLSKKRLFTESSRLLRTQRTRRECCKIFVAKTLQSVLSCKAALDAVGLAAVSTAGATSRRQVEPGE